MMRRVILFLIVLMPSLALAGQTPPQIVGTWADPRTFLYQQQIQRVIDVYTQYCVATPRSATYYFSTSGSDANNGLTSGTPKQTIAAANALLDDGYTAILLKRGDTFTGTVGFSDGGASFAYIGAYGTGNKPIIQGSAEPTDHGVDLSGDGSVVRDVRCTGWGNDGATAYGVAQTNAGANVTMAIDCDLDDNAAHNQGGINSASGGIFVCIRVKNGAFEWATGTNFVGYSAGGGQWLIMDDCEITAGEDGGAQNFGVYMHTAGGAAYNGGFICRNLRITGGAVNTAALANQNPSLAKKDYANFVMIGTEHLGFVAGSATSCAIDRGWLINSRFQVKPNNGQNGFGHGATGYTINSIFEVDCSAYASFNSPAFWSSTTYGNSVSPKVYNSAILFKSHASSATGAIFEYQTGANSASDRTPDAECVNNIILANGTQAIRLGLANVDVINRNAVKGITSGGAYADDANRIDLLDYPLVYSLASGGISQTAGVAKALPDGVRLEFDYFNRPRSSGAQNVGPIECDYGLLGGRPTLSTGTVIKRRYP